MAQIKGKEARDILGIPRDKFYELVRDGKLKETPPDPGHLSPTFDEDAVRALKAKLDSEALGVSAVINTAGTPPAALEFGSEAMEPPNQPVPGRHPGRRPEVPPDPQTKGGATSSIT